jgi:Mn2+/Fe2+ NRAMP family transporter
LKANRAKAFHGTIAAAFLLGALLNFTPLDPIKALFWSAVVNGVVAVPVMAMMMMLATRKAVMGQFTVGPILNGFGWLATGVMALAGIGMFVTMR